MHRRFLRVRIDDRRSGSFLAGADFAEVSGHVPVIVLAPLFERMMMALGTGEAHAEKELAGVVDG